MSACSYCLVDYVENQLCVLFNHVYYDFVNLMNIPFNLLLSKFKCRRLFSFLLHGSSFILLITLSAFLCTLFIFPVSFRCEDQCYTQYAKCRSNKVFNSGKVMPTMLFTLPFLVTQSAPVTL